MGEGVRIVRNDTPKFPSGAYIHAASVANGMVFCRLDCGDVWFPREKREQVQLSLDTGRPTFALTRDELGRNKVRRLNERWMFDIYMGNQFQGSSFVIPRNVWQRCMPNPQLRHVDDWDLAMRIQHQFGWLYFPKCTGAATEWPGGHSDWTNREESKRIRDEEIARVAAMGRALQANLFVK